MKTTSVVVLGGGLSGVAAAYALARSGVRDVTVLESGASLGGLAGSFEREGHFYPLGYHHILHRDRTLLFFLQLIGALPDVRWRRIRMLFHLGGASYDLGSPSGFLRFPMKPADKARFVRLMVTAFAKRDWSALAGPERRRAGRRLCRPGRPRVFVRATHAPQVRASLCRSERCLARRAAALPGGLLPPRVYPERQLDQGAVRRSRPRAGGCRCSRPAPDPGDPTSHRRGSRHRGRA